MASALIWIPLALGGRALAGPVDLVGFGSPSMARAGGGVALLDGAQGVFRNPALLQDMQASQLAVGGWLLRGNLDPVQEVWWDTNRDGLVDDSDSPLQVDVQPDPADAIGVALGRPIGERFGLAFAATLPVRRMLRIQTFEPSLPTYFFLDNRAQRFDMTLGFGWEQLPGLSVGGSVQVIARARFTLDTTLDVTLRGATEGDEELGALVSELTLDPHTMTLDIVPGLAPVAGLHWDVGELIPALDGLALAGNYRGSTGLPIDVDVDLQANLDLRDVGDLEPLGTTVLVPIHLAVFDHYLPARWTMGAGWTSPDRFRAFVDLFHTRYAPMQISVAHVVDTEVQSQLLQLPDPSVADGNPVTATLRNTWSTKAGGEVYLPRWEPGRGIGWLQGVVRGGFGYEPSPLVAQGSTSALLDADRLILAGGLGVAHGAPFGLIEGPVSWDAHVQVHMLGEGSLPVDTTTYRPGAPVDGGGVPIGGTLWSAGAQWSIDY